MRARRQGAPGQGARVARALGGFRQRPAIVQHLQIHQIQLGIAHVEQPGAERGRPQLDLPDQPDGTPSFPEIGGGHHGPLPLRQARAHLVECPLPALVVQDRHRWPDIDRLVPVAQHDRRLRQALGRQRRQADEAARQQPHPQPVPQRPDRPCTPDSAPDRHSEPSRIRKRPSGNVFRFRQMCPKLKRGGASPGPVGRTTRGCGCFPAVRCTWLAAC